MTQRQKTYPSPLNMEAVVCEKYISRFLQRDKTGALTPKAITSSVPVQKRDKIVKQSPVSSANPNQLSKIRPNVKQQNLPSPVSDPRTLASDYHYGDDAALVQVTVKTTNPRQRSRSTVANREPWGQLLKQQRSSDKISVFSSFDPLRTLHFLAKELRYQLQAIMPDNTNMLQMVADMQNALKRVPPEIASTIHLQQAIDLLPSKKGSKLLHEKPEKLKVNAMEAATQTLATNEQEECNRLHKVMEESTVKLEESCKQMEMLCGQLKNEKETLEKELQSERYSAEFLKKRVEDLEFENAEILTPKIKSLEEEKRKMETELDALILKIETQSVVSATEVKSLMTELKNSKAIVEQECTKLKHQLRVSAIEKEKFVAVLSVRDRQISEIRTEMTQLQEVVNDQLLDLHNNAFTCMPSSATVATNPPGTWHLDNNKENIGDIGNGTLSTIHSNDDTGRMFMPNKPNIFKDAPTGDKCVPTVLQEMPENYCGGKSTEAHKVSQQRRSASPPFLERRDSQASIRSMFSELKATAYAIASTPQTSQPNIKSSRQ